MTLIWMNGSQGQQFAAAVAEVGVVRVAAVAARAAVVVAKVVVRAVVKVKVRVMLVLAEPQAVLKGVLILEGLPILALLTLAVQILALLILERRLRGLPVLGD